MGGNWIPLLRYGRGRSGGSEGSEVGRATIAFDSTLARSFGARSTVGPARARRRSALDSTRAVRRNPTRARERQQNERSRPTLLAKARRLGLRGDTRSPETLRTEPPRILSRRRRDTTPSAVPGRLRRWKERPRPPAPERPHSTYPPRPTARHTQGGSVDLRRAEERPPASARLRCSSPRTLVSVRRNSRANRL